MFACGRLIFNRNDIYKDVSSTRNNDVTTQSNDITARKNDVTVKSSANGLRKSIASVSKKFTLERWLDIRDYLKTVRGKDGKLKLVLRRKYKKEPR